MIKKLTKHGNNLALIIDKSILEILGIDAKTDFEMLVIGDTLIIKPKGNRSQANKKRQAQLVDTANSIMDQYESVFKKLAKT